MNLKTTDLKLFGFTEQSDGSFLQIYANLDTGIKISELEWHAEMGQEIGHYHLEFFDLDSDRTLLNSFKCVSINECLRIITTWKILNTN